MKDKYNFLTKELLQKYYDELKSFKLISEKYNINLSAIKYYCKKFNIQTIPKLKYNLDHNIFSKETEESFYLAGFIAADGCVMAHKSKVPNCLTISLAKIDLDHLEKLKNILKFSGPTETNNRELSKYNENCKGIYTQKRFTIYSKQIVNDLYNNFGIGPRKSLTYQFPQNIINHNLVRHFMRGYFDGDGSIHIGKENRKTKIGTSIQEKLIFSIIGTEDFVSNYRNIIHRECNFISNAKLQYKDHTYMLRFSGNGMCKSVYHYLYDNSSIFLERKYKIFTDNL